MQILLRESFDVHGHEVGLVEEDNERFAPGIAEDLGRQRGELRFGLRAVDHKKDDLCFGEFLPTALDAHLLYGIGGGAQAGSVDEAEERAAKIVGVLDDIAGGAMDVAHDGALVVEKGIEEGGFSRIGTAYDGHGEAIFEGIAGGEGVHQPRHHLFQVLGQMGQFGAVGKLQVFMVGEVEFEFEQGGEVKQAFAQLFQLSAEVAAQLTHGDAVVGGGGGCYHIGHGFCLREVQPSVEKGTLGKLPRGGRNGSGVDEEAEDGLQNIL